MIEIMDPLLNFQPFSPGQNISSLNVTSTSPNFIGSLGAGVAYDFRPFVAQGMTVRFTFLGSNKWGFAVITAQVNRNTSSIVTSNGFYCHLNPVTLTANRFISAPDADVDLGNLSSVATTNGNVLSGTRTRILGGSYNTVSGTDNVVVMGTNNTLNTSEVVVEGADWYNTTLFPLPRQTVKSSKASATTSKRVIRSTVCLTSGPDGIGKYATVDGTQTLTASYLPKAVAYDAAKIRRATHKITAMVHSDGNVEGGFFERIVRVTQLNASSTAIADSKIVVTDTDDFGLSSHYGLTITLSASAGDALLKIVGTCTSISGGTPNNCSVSCVVESIYHIDS